MILFLNFAPFNFAGGAERWMLDISDAVSNLEKVILIDVDPSIANIYGKFILKRQFDKRLTLHKSNSRKQHISLTFWSFIPFSSEWKMAKSVFAGARMVYMRYEFLEWFIILFFGGLAAYKKTVAGIHSPYLYSRPVSLLDRLHNFFYSLRLSRFFLSIMHKTHVNNSFDQNYFIQTSHLQNVVHVPNYLTLGNAKITPQTTSNNNLLHIAYVGELNLRKGADILIRTIGRSPKNFMFHIVGDGPMKKDIKKLMPLHNVVYEGYLEKNELIKLYRNCDVLFIPSRAETFSLVCLEAMSYGLPIISSPQIRMGFPQYFQLINKNETAEGYLDFFNVLLNKKNKSELVNLKIRIADYIRENFARDVIIPKLFKYVFEIEDNTLYKAQPKIQSHKSEIGTVVKSYTNA